MALLRYGNAIFKEDEGMKDYFFCIADLKIRVSSPWEISFWKRMEPFISAEAAEGEADIWYRLEEADESIQGESEGKLKWEDGEREYRLQVKRTYIEEGTVFKNSNILPMMRLENVFLEKGGFFLHAAVISWKGKGILFSAPSGTGKTTQAELWKKYEGAEIINGDRAVVRKKEDGYWAYGSPYAGTSGIFKNEKVKIEAIFLLKQAPYNKISVPEVKEIFKRIYMETTLHPSDEEYMNKMVNILADVVMAIPIYQLECTPTKEAVDMVRVFLEN